MRTHGLLLRDLPHLQQLAPPAEPGQRGDKRWFRSRVLAGIACKRQGKRKLVGVVRVEWGAVMVVGAPGRFAEEAPEGGSQGFGDSGDGVVDGIHGIG